MQKHADVDTSAPSACAYAEDQQGRNLHEWLLDSCDVCKLPTDEAMMVICDHLTCNRMFHTYCLSPPLLKVPDGDWVCPQCISALDD